MTMEDKKLPEKVILMYDAVIGMLEDGIDLNQMKVIDITKRAGIGKGTAYEYVSSKEELIVGALLYDIQKQFERVIGVITATDGFQPKVERILDWILDNFRECKTFALFARIGMGTYDISEHLQNEMRKAHTKECCVTNTLEQVVDEILECGVMEGILKPVKKELQRMAFGSQILIFSMYLADLEHRKQSELSMEEVKRFTYESIVKALN